ncbi:MAG TPA: hypothetical protein DCP51_05700, partial [Clostridiales bacterium]|nr:hypothetical protein [Clostridiales bacterium]
NHLKTLYRDTHLVHKPCTRTAKSAPWLPRHRDYIAAKEPGLITGWLRQPTLTYFIARPLWALALNQSSLP